MKSNRQSFGRTTILSFLTFLTFLFVLNIFLSCVAPYTSTTYTSATQTRGETIPEIENEFTIIVWNTAKSNILDIKPVFTLFQSYSPTFYLFQEAIDLIEIDSTSKVSSTNVTSQSYSFGLVALSTREPILYKTYYSNSTEPFVFTPKTIQTMIYNLRNTPVLVINVHLLNFVDFPAYENQLHQLDEILATFNGPVILAGDFNSWNWKRYRALRVVTEKHRLELTDFKSDNRFIRRVLFSQPIDRVYFRYFNQKKSRVELMDNHSDHNALIVTLEARFP